MGAWSPASALSALTTSGKKGVIIMTTANNITVLGLCPCCDLDILDVVCLARSISIP